MWVVDQNREQFVQMLQREIAPSEIASLEQGREVGSNLATGRIRVVWAHRPESGILPAVLVIPERDRRDFFAWANTYLEGWRPISSLFRVVCDRDAGVALGAGSGRESLWEFRNAALGVILGEAASRNGGAGRVDGAGKSPLGVCVSTCAFAMGRAICVGWWDLARVGENWHRAQVMAAHRPSYVAELGDLVGAWSVVGEVGGLPVRAECGSRRVSEAVVALCRGLHARDELDEGALAVLTKDSADLGAAFQEMGGTRERRVKAFDSALRESVGRRRRSQKTTAIALGLLASRIAPGSFEHVSLVIPDRGRLEGVLVWYGLFAGVTRGARLADHYGGLGRRVLAEMLMGDTAFSRPRCDVGLDELEVIGMSTMYRGQLLRVSPGRLAIEIVPCVNTVAAWLEEPKAGDRQGRLFEEEAKGLESDVREVNRAAERLLRRVRRLGLGKG